MKHLLLVAAGLFFAVSANAQITLTSSSFPASVYGTDSLKVTDSASAFPSLAPGTSASWDMSTVTDSPGFHYIYHVAAATYTYADSSWFSFGGFGYQGNVLNNITASALLEYGIKIPRTANHIATAWSGLTDSIVFDNQTIIYSTPRKVLALPATMSTNWSSNYQFDFDYHITAAELSLTNAPGIVRTFTSETDSVVGWGRMRVKDASGSPSAWFNVLQVKRIIINTDSFFINGAPMTAPLITFLGLTQGQKDTTWQHSYYRVNEVTPLAEVDFTDQTFSQPSTATTHVSRVANNAVANIPNAAEIKVYPNPTTGNLFAEVPAGEWTYQVTDVTGKVIVSGEKQTGNIVHCQLPGSLSAGVYLLKLINDGNIICVKEIEFGK